MNTLIKIEFNNILISYIFYNVYCVQKDEINSKTGTGIVKMINIYNRKIMNIFENKNEKWKKMIFHSVETIEKNKWKTDETIFEKHCFAEEKTNVLI